MSLGIYIHIPFCIKKCAYCDFLSFPVDDDAKKQYISALKSQIENSPKSKIDSVFIGGGTPSVLDGSDVVSLMESVRKTFEIEWDCETTIEINPATVTKEKLYLYRKAGINRISMGVQSFCDSELKILGRMHNAKQAKESFYLLRQAGFENINLDLMFAIPLQTKESFFQSLKETATLSPEHISAYSLIIEEGTPFCKMEEEGLISQADEDLYVDMFSIAGNFLEDNGYDRYEISNFAKSGFESRHNLKYWSGGEYYGFGLGAVGFLSNVRYENTNDMGEYLQGKGAEKYVLSQKELIKEYIITSLRRTKGIVLSEFKEKFSNDFLNLYDIQKYTDGGFMKEEDGRVFFTEEGIRVSNQILCMFI